MNSLIIILPFFLICNFSFAQNKISTEDTTSTLYYKIDTTMKSQLDSERVIWEKKYYPVKIRGGLLDIEAFMNDKEYFASVEKDKIEFPFLVNKVDEKDSSILIVGAIERESGGKTAFQIYIQKEKCYVFLIEMNKDENSIYKKHKKDHEYSSSIKVGTQYQFALTKSPSFKKGEILQGIVLLRSFDYFMKAKKGEEHLMNTNLFAYFKTPPLE